MRAPLPVRALVAGSELPAEDLVRDLLRLYRERRVDLGRVEQERCLCLVKVLLFVFLVFYNEPFHSVGDGGMHAPGGPRARGYQLRERQRSPGSNP